MNRTVICENSATYLNTDNPVDRALSVNTSTNVHDSTKGTLDEKDFFAMFDEIWSKLLMLAKQLRDTMQFYNQKKQELGWGLEINTLHKSFVAINESYGAAIAGGVGSICGGVLSMGGALSGFSRFGDVGMALGTATGPMASGIGNCVSGDKTREADTDKALAELNNKGAQSYAKTLDDTLLKAREIMQQIMEWGRNLVEVLNRVLSAISR